MKESNEMHLSSIKKGMIYLISSHDRQYMSQTGLTGQLTYISAFLQKEFLITSIFGIVAVISLGLSMVALGSSKNLFGFEYYGWIVVALALFSLLIYVWRTTHSIIREIEHSKKYLKTHMESAEATHKLAKELIEMLMNDE